MYMHSNNTCLLHHIASRSLATQLRRLQAAVTKSATVAAKDHKTQVGAVLMVSCELCGDLILY